MGNHSIINDKNNDSNQYLLGTLYVPVMVNYFFILQYLMLKQIYKNCIFMLITQRGTMTENHGENHK
jgi:hypothetical protein